MSEQSVFSSKKIRHLPVWVGLVLLVVYYSWVQLIPQGPFEFSYAPFVPGPLPFAPMRGFTYEQLMGHILRVVLATPALLLLAFGLHKAFQLDPPTDQQTLRLVWIIGGISILITTILLFVVYQGRAIVDDELAYSQHAMLLWEGKLGNRMLPFQILEPMTILGQYGYTSKYLFGEPLVQILGTLVGYPALLHIPLTIVTFVATFHMAKMATDDRHIASWSVILLAVSPMLLLTTPTGQSQATSLCCVALIGLGYQYLHKQRYNLGTLWLVLGIGFGMTVRPQTIGPIGLVFGIAAVTCLIRHKQWKALVGLLLGLGLWAGSILFYNQAITGEMFKLPWMLSKTTEHYGFVKVFDKWIYVHTPWRALQNLFVTGIRWNAWWLGWPSSLLLFCVWLKWGRPRQGMMVWFWAALSLVLFQAGYYSNGVSDTGVMYYYELLIPAALVGAHTIVVAFQKRPDLTWVVLFLHIMMGTATFVWFQTSRIQRLVHTIHDDADRAIQAIKLTGKPAFLLYEKDCTEVLQWGWVFSGFPKRYHSRRYSVVTYPRPDLGWMMAYSRAFSDRVCWYYRRNPGTYEPELQPCQYVRELLKRPVKRGKQCMWVPPTATRKKLFSPWSAAKKWLLPTKKSHKQ